MAVELKTQAAWWSLVDEKWVDLCKIMDFYSTLKEVERAVQAKQERDWRTLYLHFLMIWASASERAPVTKLPGWLEFQVLCDRALDLFVR